MPAQISMLTHISMLTQIIYGNSKLDAEDSKEEHEKADKDGDGQLTWLEYIGETYGFNKEDMDEFDKLESHDHSDFDEVFMLYDECYSVYNMLYDSVYFNISSVEINIMYYTVVCLILCCSYVILMTIPTLDYISIKSLNFELLRYLVKQMWKLISTTKRKVLNCSPASQWWADE